MVLASTSVYRQELLRRLGIPFISVPPQVDEELEKSKNLPPKELAEHLARLKARALAQEGRVVIGGDQLVHWQGKVLGKPHTVKKAVSQLQALAGQWHELITAVCVCDGLREHVFTDITRLQVRELTLEEIQAYVQRDQPLDCAGSYKIEKAGIALMDKIESEDFTSIQGLPLLKLSKILRQTGFNFL